MSFRLYPKLPPAERPATDLLATANLLLQSPFTGKIKYSFPPLRAMVNSQTEELTLVNCCEGTGTGLFQPVVASPTIYKLVGSTLLYGVTVYLPDWKSKMILYKSEVAGLENYRLNYNQNPRRHSYRHYCL